MPQIPSDVIQAAQNSQAKWRIPASVTIAQWALESAWGSRMPPGSNNPFGIKAAKGQPAVASATHEVIGGVSRPTTAYFRRYASLDDAFDDHGRLLATASSYARARQEIGDPNAFARALTGVYATDPHYGEKLIATMQAHNLYQYDTAEA